MSEKINKDDKTEILDISDLVIKDNLTNKKKEFEEIQNQYNSIKEKFDSLLKEHTNKTKELTNIRDGVKLTQGTVNSLNTTLASQGREKSRTTVKDKAIAVTALKKLEEDELNKSLDVKELAQKLEALNKSKKDLEEKGKKLDTEIKDIKKKQREEESSVFNLSAKNVYRGDDDYLNMSAINKLENEQRAKKLKSFQGENCGMNYLCPKNEEGRIRAFRILGFEYFMKKREKAKKKKYPPLYVIEAALDNKKLMVDKEIRDYIWDIKTSIKEWTERLSIETYKVNIVYHEYQKFYNLGCLGALVGIETHENYLSNLSYVRTITEDEKVVFKNLLKDKELGKQFGYRDNLEGYGAYRGKGIKKYGKTKFIKPTSQRKSYPKKGTPKKFGKNKKKAFVKHTPEEKKAYQTAQKAKKINPKKE